MEGFLADIAQWIKDRPVSNDPSYVSYNGHNFAANDNQVCREAFATIETQYLAMLESRAAV